MRLFGVPLALLLIALGVPLNAQKSTGRTESEVVVVEGKPLRIECEVRVEQRAEWRVGEGAAPAGDLRAAETPAAGGGVRAVLAAPAARAAHAGRYTCARGAGHAVRVTVLPAPSASLGDGGAVTSSTSSPGGEPGADRDGAGDLPLDTLQYQVGRPGAITLNCTPSEAIPGVFTYVWKKNGTEVDSLSDLKDRYELSEGGAVFRNKGRAHEDDFGNYTCWIGGAVARGWRVVGRPVAKLPANLNVVEGQKLKVTCKVIGKPYPPVTWRYVDADGNATAVSAALGERASTAPSAAGVPGAELALAAAARGDAGRYECAPAGGEPAATTLRVKGMYDALWPFLGICAEVFLLCAIILIYEKRRTKPELDDSDTDNHDQKKS